MSSGLSLNSSASSSSSLLVRLRRHDPQAWWRLSKLYGPLVYRWARQGGLQEQDVADVAQDVFRAVAADLPKYTGQSTGDSFRRWLWGITRNKLTDHFRRMTQQPPAVGGTDAQLRLQQFSDAPPEDSDQSDGFDSRASLLHRALDLLRSEFEDRTWQAFWRTTVDSLKSADVADELGMTKKAVRQAKYRVLRRLRIELDGQLE